MPTAGVGLIAPSASSKLFYLIFYLIRIFEFINFGGLVIGQNLKKKKSTLGYRVNFQKKRPGPGSVVNVGHFFNGKGVTPTLHPPGVSGNSRSRPFPGIPASHSRSQSLGMSFSFLFRKLGNAIFHSSSQNLGMQFPFPFPLQGMDYQCRE